MIEKVEKHVMQRYDAASMLVAGDQASSYNQADTDYMSSVARSSMNQERELRIHNLLEASKMLQQYGHRAAAEETFYDALTMMGYQVQNRHSER